MARPTTVARVFAAVLQLAERGGPNALTMEGIAAEAGVGKQTLYRTWPSVHALVFEALAAESTAAESLVGCSTLVEALKVTRAELASEPRASLLRTLAAAIQSDETIAHQFHTMLLHPQRQQFARLVAADGFADADRAAELLLAPLLSRWLLRLPPPTDAEMEDHVDAVRRLERGPSMDGSGQTPEAAVRAGR